MKRKPHALPNSQRSQRHYRGWVRSSGAGSYDEESPAQERRNRLRETIIAIVEPKREW
jgi:hypothetical protein